MLASQLSAADEEDVLSELAALQAEQVSAPTQPTDSSLKLTQASTSAAAAEHARRAAWQLARGCARAGQAGRGRGEDRGARTAGHSSLTEYGYWGIDTVSVIMVLYNTGQRGTIQPSNCLLRFAVGGRAAASRHSFRYARCGAEETRPREMIAEGGLVSAEWIMVSSERRNRQFRRTSYRNVGPRCLGIMGPESSWV